VTNQLIREAPHPYPESLHIVTKAGATRDGHGGWPPAREPDDLRRSVHENLQTLGLEALEALDLVTSASATPEDPSPARSPSRSRPSSNSSSTASSGTSE